MVRSEQMRIYLDHNATTPVDSAVVDTVSNVLRNCYGNASSVHTFGQSAKALLDDARSDVAALLGAKPAEIVFTGGGTESDNLAIRGAAGLQTPPGRRHLITSTIEHEAVLNTIKDLTRHGWTATYLPVGASGIVNPPDLEDAISEQTALVSIMHANNEVGTLQPINELASIAHSFGALFHTDAVQTAGKYPISVSELNVDLLSISGHKFNGPKGVGALWIKRGTRLTSNLTGGRQERNRRAGTENVAGIAGLGIAAQIASNKLTREASRLGHLRDRLESDILCNVAGAELNGTGQRISNTTNISFQGIEAEALLIALDLEGIAVSTGSACSSGTLEPSHVLRAMGLTPQRAQSSIRFSLGLGNTEEQIIRVVESLPPIVSKLQNLSGHHAVSRT
ncbi:MAG: cysteine desulfurase family protein [Vicinamibacterales bacterium]